MCTGRHIQYRGRDISRARGGRPRTFPLIIILPRDTRATSLQPNLRNSEAVADESWTGRGEGGQRGEKEKVKERRVQKEGQEGA